MRGGFHFSLGSKSFFFLFFLEFLSGLAVPPQGKSHQPPETHEALAHGHRWVGEV